MAEQLTIRTLIAQLDQLVNLDGVSPDAPVWYPASKGSPVNYTQLTSAEISIEDDGAGTYVQFG